MELKLKHLRLFYDAFKPNYVAAFVYTKQTDTQRPFKERYVKDWDDFLTFMKNNSEHVLYSCYRPLKPNSPSRNMNEVVFHEYFFIDIDDLSVEKKFETFMINNNIKWKFKAASGGGLHYYIPTSPIEIDDKGKLERLKTTSSLLRDWYVDNNIMVDKKIIDLARFARPWGTFNYRRNKYCELIDSVKLEVKDIEINTDFIFNLKPKNATVFQAPHTKITQCEICEHCINFKFPKENTEKNDVLLKNTAGYLKENGRSFNEAKLAAITQEHNPAEMTGWWNKDIKFNCIEMRKWLKKYYPEKVPKMCNKCMLENKNNILYLNDQTMDYNSLKVEFSTELKFPINKFYTLRGNVKPSKEYKISLIIGFKYRKIGETEIKELNDLDGDTVFINYFDDGRIAKKNELKKMGLEYLGDVTADFYVYDFIVEDSNYKLLSEVQLDTGEMIVDGNVVKMVDKVKFGEDRKIDAKIFLFFAHTASSTVPKYDTWNDVFEQYQYDENTTMDYIFYKEMGERERYILKYPRMLSQLIKAFLFSGKINRYPLHLLISGTPGNGKSWLLETLTSKFDEPHRMIDCGSSTIKSFLPSYANGKYNKGYLLSNKIMLSSDEFFKLFLNSVDDNSKIQMFNAILENLDTEHGSAYGSYTGIMNCKSIWATNPVDVKNSGFIYSVKQFPESALQRFLIVHVGEELTQFIINNHPERIKEKLRVDKKKFLSLMAFMISDESYIEYDSERLRKIIHNMRGKVPTDIDHLYKVRTMEHHGPLLFEGLVKFRCLFEKDDALTAKDIDYTEFEELWIWIIESWNDKGGVVLTKDESNVISLIPNNGINRETLIRSAMKTYHMDDVRILKVLKELRKFGYIRNGTVENMDHNKVYLELKKDEIMDLSQF